jgi:DNA-directed RNA polymerase subunit M/transcription elongation factor TFIIS
MKLCCSKCGSISLLRNEIIRVQAYIKGKENDKGYEYVGESEIDWDSQTRDLDRPEFYCPACGNEWNLK